MNAITHTRAPTSVLTPTTFDQLVTFAEIAANSDMVPKDFKGKPGNIMIACQFGSELGLSPMQSLQSIAIINGRPGIWGDGLLGLCRQSPLCEDIHETLEGEGDAREAVCTAKRRGASPVIGRFSVADAKRAQLWGKAIWAAYPDRMLKNRARGFALRDAFPDVLRGLKAAEELIDTPPEDDFRGTTIEAKPATNSGSSPISGKPTPSVSTMRDMQADRTATREAAQKAAVTPPPKKMTIAEFLDQLDKELELAPEATAVHALMMSDRVTNARGFLTNGAGERLSAWTIRAGQKRAALQEAERQAAAPVVQEPPKASEMAHNTAPPPADPLNGPMPESIDEWPLAGEEMAGG